MTDIVQRYRETYGFAAEAELDADRINAHWELEQALTARILATTPDDRWSVTEQAYTELYQSLRWHDELPKVPAKPVVLDDWIRAVGEGPFDIYEVGSGQGALLTALAEQGHRCRGSEITTERGSRYDSETKLSWGNTDGVHLDRFETPGSFDVVITNQVLEHLHPDDVPEHFRSARELLRPGGRYIASVPHRLTGPHDVSDIFGSPTAVGMHLREYTWSEIARAMRAAGFGSVEAASLVRLGVDDPRIRPILGRGYLAAMRGLEAALSAIPDRQRQQKLSRALKDKRIFADNIFVIAHH